MAHRGFPSRQEPPRRCKARRPPTIQEEQRSGSRSGGCAVDCGHNPLPRNVASLRRRCPTDISRLRSRAIQGPASRPLPSHSAPALAKNVAEPWLEGWPDWGEGSGLAGSEWEATNQTRTSRHFPQCQRGGLRRRGPSSSSKYDSWASMGVGRSARSQYVTASEAPALGRSGLVAFPASEVLLQAGDGEGSSAAAQCATGRGAARCANSCKAPR